MYNSAMQTIEASQVLTTNLNKPVILEQNGHPVAVLLSISEFQHYQQLLAKQPLLSAKEAQHSADRALFGDLVGCALTSGEPVWAAKPTPQWRIPYRLFDGTLVEVVTVDAVTAEVRLTEVARNRLLDRVEQLVEKMDITPSQILYHDPALGDGPTSANQAEFLLAWSDMSEQAALLQPLSKT